MDLKREFLGYLRTVYGGQPIPTAQMSLPPLDSPVIYPAFRDSGLNQGLGLLGGMQQPMSPSGLGSPSMSGEKTGLMQAQDVLLGR